MMSKEIYTKEEEYLTDLAARAGLPEGFRCATVPMTFFPDEIEASEPLPMNLSAIVLDEPTADFAVTLTKNLFPGAPVKIARKRIESEKVQGVLINNKISNVCAENGEADAEVLLSEFAGLVGIKSEMLFSASTGVIGWKLPVADIIGNLPALSGALQSSTIADVARGIMTTDLFPKVRSINIGEGRICAIAKGAGMIEPNMATLLVFILTDIKIERSELRRIHARVIGETFNRISIDSDQSTSDMALLLSSGKRPPVDSEDFTQALFSVYASLAEDVVRNGEGTGHVIRAKVSGAPNEDLAVELGKAVINSPLVKTAVFGDDPNVGRIIMAIGDYIGTRGIPITSEDIEISIGGQTVFSGGCFSLDESKEKMLADHMKSARLNPDSNRFPSHQNCVEIGLYLGTGDIEVEVLGSDLSYGYVRENADYRT
jgi:glutamate N-acetyltransferase / amino-acid N-acetyltransferase